MVYVSRDGTVHNSAPWSLERLIGLFWGLLNFIWMFFRTMFNPDMNRHGSSYTRDYRGGGGPPRPPQRRMGRITRLSDCNIPGGG